MKKFYLILLSSIILLTPQKSQSKDLEISFFGVPLNKAITIPECQYRMIQTPKYLWKNPKIKEMQGDYFRATADTGSCYQRNIFTRTGSSLPVENEILAISYPISQEPTSGKNLTAYILDGRVQRITFDTDGIKTQSIVFDSIVSKIGSPKSVENPEVQTISGAKFNSIIASWELPDGTTAAFVSAPARITEGTFVIGTKKGLQSFDENFRPKKTGTEM